MMSIKIERIASNIVKEVSYILRNEVRNPELKFVSVTDAQVSSDLSYAKIYVTALNPEKKEEIIEELKKSSGYIRKKLAERIDIRHIPDLNFVYDESIEYGKKIENLIESIHENKEG